MMFLVYAWLAVGISPTLPYLLEHLNYTYLNELDLGSFCFLFIDIDAYMNRGRKIEF